MTPSACTGSNLEVYAFNPRARHLYDKLGFVHEGTKRQALRWDGEWVDAHIMAILADEWARREPPDPSDRRNPLDPSDRRASTTSA